jgi:hypothetical protein
VAITAAAALPYRIAGVMPSIKDNTLSIACSNIKQRVTTDIVDTGSCYRRLLNWYCWRRRHCRGYCCCCCFCNGTHACCTKLQNIAAPFLHASLQFNSASAAAAVPAAASPATAAVAAASASAAFSQPDACVLLLLGPANCPFKEYFAIQYCAAVLLLLLLLLLLLVHSSLHMCAVPFTPTCRSFGK